MSLFHHSAFALTLIFCSVSVKRVCVCKLLKLKFHLQMLLQVDRISTFSPNMGGTDLVNRIVSLEKENDGLRKCKHHKNRRKQIFQLIFLSG